MKSSVVALPPANFDVYVRKVRKNVSSPTVNRSASSVERAAVVHARAEHLLAVARIAGWRRCRRSARTDRASPARSASPACRSRVRSTAIRRRSRTLRSTTRPSTASVSRCRRTTGEPARARPRPRDRTGRHRDRVDAERRQRLSLEREPGSLVDHESAVDVEREGAEVAFRTTRSSPTCARTRPTRPAGMSGFDASTTLRIVMPSGPAAVVTW